MIDYCYRLYRANPDKHQIRAFDGGRFVGALSWNRWSGKVSLVWVEPTYRRHGIATELWRRAQAYEPRPVHQDPGPELTDDGAAWSASLARAA